jgi:oligoribonuclease
LYWLDLETTGLDPTRDVLLELAIAEADLEHPFDIGPISNYVFGWDDTPRKGPMFGSGTMNDLVRTTHTKNGLLEECKVSSWSVHDVEEQLLTLVPEVSGDDKPTLAGSSVHFDAGFLRVHMPRLAARFSHRYYDVSAVKLFCRSLGMTKIPKAEAHRASEDILESIEHAKLCVKWIAALRFRTGPGEIDMIDRTLSSNGEQ